LATIISILDLKSMYDIRLAIIFATWACSSYMLPELASPPWWGALPWREKAMLNFLTLA
jgi:hypothetical protein